MEQSILDNIMELFISPEFLAGLLFTFVCYFLINLFLSHSFSHEDWNLSEKNSITSEIFKRAFRIYDQIPFNVSILGFLEIIFYYIAIYLNLADLIVAWLAFKVASKWNTWSTIAKVPEHLQNVHGFDYLEAKNKVSAITLQRWFLGNLLNILGAFCSVFLGCLFANIFLK